MKRILVIRFSSIGDIVLTSPVVRALKKQLNAEVHFITKKAFAPIVEANPYIDKVFSINSKVKEVLPELKQQQYHAVIDLHRNLRSAQIKMAVPGPAYSFDKLNLEKWLLVNLKVNQLPDKHIVARYMDTLKELGVYYDGRGLDYFIPPKDEVQIPELAIRHQLPELSRGYVAFVIGAAHATKRLPEDKIIRICQQLSEPVLLLGGAAEQEQGQRIATAAGSHVVNTCGDFKLHQSASLIRQARKVLTPDTGLMHIAAAFNKEIVSVWGNTVPEFGMYPFYPMDENYNVSLEVKGLSCRPCSKIGYGKCPKKHFRCMQDIAEEAIIQALH